MPTRRLVTLSATAVALAGVLAWRLSAAPSAATDDDVSEILTAAQTSLRAKNFTATEEALSYLLEQESPPARTYLVAGELAFHQGDIKRAVEFFQAVPHDGSVDEANAHFAIGDINFGQQHYTDAEQRYLEVLSIAPEQKLAHERLIFIYNLEGRRIEALPHMMHLLRRRIFHLRDLCMLINMDAVNTANDDSAGAAERLEAVPAYHIGLGREAIKVGDYEDALEHLNFARAGRQDLLEPLIWLGRTYALMGDSPKFAEWAEEIGEAGKGHPEYWQTRAIWELRHDRLDGALRALWEGLRIDSNYATLARTFVETLARSGRTELAKSLAGWKEDLVELAITSVRVYEDPHAFQADQVTATAARLERLGRLWEACAWSQIGTEMSSKYPENHDRLKRLTPLLDDSLRRQVRDRNPIARIDLSDLPLPQTIGDPKLVSAPDKTPATTGNDTPPVGIHFEDESASRGIEATFHFSEDLATKGGRMFEFTGGGTAAVDYDRDGLVDAYFTQGTDWPPNPANFEYVDFLFRQRPNGVFEDVAADAAIRENSFSQGVTYGDWNQDGFPDIYVANIGRNRLYINNGDGTFRDASDEAGIQRETWTTSVLMADLTGDGLPDLYDVNYVHEDDVYERICERDGAPGACAPIAFNPLGDHLILNDGHGGAIDATESSGLSDHVGNGLGIQLFRDEGAQGPQLFVANDMNANHAFTCVATNDPAAPVRLQEDGVLSGLAYSEDNTAQACMGVAHGDFDNNGHFDLFVTNFQHEYNTLYRPFAPGYFTDESQEFGVVEPSLPYVAFGTEFADFNLDGFDDIFIANGHVDEVGGKRNNYFQPPQVMLNVDGKTFREVSGEELGPYFQALRRGRAVATLDWNRDGRVDIATSNLDAPVALLTNETETSGQFVSLRLVATSGDRDALLTTCRVTTSKITKLAQLTSGDGYQTVNERMLHIGLGDAGEKISIRVTWPNGDTETFDRVEPNRRYAAVQRAGSLLPLP